MKDSKYYIVENKALATAIAFISGQTYYTFDDRYCKDRKLYSFLKTKKFEDILTTIINLKKQYNENN